MTKDEREQAWARLEARLRTLEDHIKTTPAGPQRLYGFADRFVALVKDYHAVVIAEEKTSIRLEAALHALDLKTAKGRLLEFLGREA